MSMVDDPSLDNLIPPDVWERIERERNAWREKAKKASERMPTLESSILPLPDAWLGLSADEKRFYHDAPYDTERIDPEALRERTASHPGAWVRVFGNAETSRSIATLRKHGEVFARPARPRSDGQPVGWEIYVRVADAAQPVSY